MKNIAQDTIYALSTHYGQSAIAVIRITGGNCKKIGRKICGIKQLKHRFANYSKIKDLNSNLIDRGIVIYFQGPRSYTGEDVLEIHTHGSVAVINALTKILSKLAKTRPALPGEFSKRAFLNGKRNILHFEGINNLIRSETQNQMIIANKQVSGENSDKCFGWRDCIINNLALVDAEIEFSDDIGKTNSKQIKRSLIDIKNEIKLVCNRFDTTRNLLYGSRILIIGPTNAGKSSFFNFVLQEEKMIISPEKGTTTDQSEQSMEIFGSKVTLIDSAGIRDSKKRIEKQGIKKTLETINAVQKLIIVLSPDSFNNYNSTKIREIFEKIKEKKAIVIFNKLDLTNFKVKYNQWTKIVPELRKMKSLAISCKQSFNDIRILKKVYKFIDSNLLHDETINEDYYFSEVRQLDCLKSTLQNLEKALEHFDVSELCAKFLRDSLYDLDALYGRHDDEKKLGFIFKNFCIGK